MSTPEEQRRVARLYRNIAKVHFAPSVREVLTKLRTKPLNRRRIVFLSEATRAILLARRQRDPHGESVFGPRLNQSAPHPAPTLTCRVIVQYQSGQVVEYRGSF